MWGLNLSALETPFCLWKNSQRTTQGKKTLSSQTLRLTTILDLEGKISEFMHKELGIPSGVSKKASERYLKAFRQCPEKPLMSLDEWRLLLWIENLGEDYEDHAEVVYNKWKKYRYRNMAISESKANFLRNLHKQYQLALVTNGPSNSQWEKIRELKLEEYFDTIVVSGDLKWEKPQPEIFHRTCKCLGVEPFECLMVGDKLETDIEGGFRAKLGIVVYFPVQDGSREELPNPPPDYIIDDITSLNTILQGGNEKKSKGMKSKPKVSSNSPSTSAGVTETSSSTTAGSSAPTKAQTSSTDDELVAEV